MKIRLLKLAALIPLLFLATASQISPALAYTNSHLIDDSVFDNVNSMSAGNIQTFLGTHYPSGCLTNYQAPDPQSWSGYGSNVSAAQVIADAAHIWGINPQVILTTLEKEEGLVSGHGAYGCSQTAFNSAMGYDCPGPIQPATGTCVAHTSNLGFSAQVSHGAWQLEFGRYRSEGGGNLGYDGDGDITYYGYMTQGTRPRCNTCTPQFYSGTITLGDGTTLSVDNGATASLYSYTPFIQSFSRIFEQFFGAGSTTGAVQQPYAAAYASQSSWPTIATGTSATAFISYKNTGTSTWYDDSSIGSAPVGSYPVHLATAAPMNRASAFGSTWGANQNRPALTFAAVYQADGTTLETNQHVAAPNDIVKFSFTFTVGSNQSAGVYQENFQPVAEGSSNGLFADPGTYLDVTVPANYVDGYVGQGTAPSLKPGQSVSTSIKYQNNGNAPWYDDLSVYSSPGSYPVHLATTHPINRSSIFGAGWGTGQNRPAYTFSAVYLADGTTLAPNQDVVGPGQIGQFNLQFQAPNQQAAGTYQEYFQPVAEGTSDGAFNDPNSSITATVVSSSVGIASTSSPTTVSMAPGSSQQFTQSFTNVGNTTWTQSSTKLVGNPSTPYQSFKSSTWPSSTIVATLNQTSVAPGATGSFTFTLTAPNGGGNYALELAPASDGTFSSPTPAKFQITVSAPSYTDQFIGQSGYPNMLPGGSSAASFSYKNTGNIAWYDDSSIGTAPAGSFPTHLATSQPTNRNSQFGSAWGANHNRPAVTFGAVYEADGTTLAGDQHVVQPGQIAKFNFTFNASATQAAGTFREYFRPVAEGSSDGAFNDPGTYLDVTITPKTYADQFTGQSAYPTIPRGQTATGFFKYKNVGNQTWYDDTALSEATAGTFPTHLATSQPTNRNSQFGATWGVNHNRPDLTFTAVYEADGTTLAADQHVATPGQIVKFQFTLTAPSALTPGTYREYLRPVAEGSADGAFNDPGTYLDITVTP